MTTSSATSSPALIWSLSSFLALKIGHSGRTRLEKSLWIALLCLVQPCLCVRVWSKSKAEQSVRSLSLNSFTWDWLYIYICGKSVFCTSTSWSKETKAKWISRHACSARVRLQPQQLADVHMLQFVVLGSAKNTLPHFATTGQPAHQHN